MQRVVRSTLAGLFVLAGLAACDDSSGTTQIIVPPGSVTSVTVTPSSTTIAIGQTTTLFAAVAADASVTDRTVTWTSSDATVATVDASGKVTGVKAGSTTIIASSKANSAIQGAAAITVAGNNNGAVPTVTISSINQTNAAGQSVPANLGNVAGQLDVVLNVETNGGILKTVRAVLTCGTDSIVNTQTVANLIAADAAAAASAPVTLSFNTAQFSSAGVAALHNGSCTISAQATTASGTQSATNSTILTVNNRDVIVGSITSTATATDAAGLTWNGGNVTVSVTPVFYTTGRTAASTAITFEGKTVTTNGTGTQTATFIDTNDPASTSAVNIDGITDPAATATVTTIDSQGQQFANTGNAIFSSSSVVANPNAPVALATIRLDTQRPVSGVLPIRNNVLQGTSGNGYINGTFRFAADSASGFCGPNSTGFNAANTGTATPVCTGNNPTANVDSGTVVQNPTNAAATKTARGVDKVTVVYQVRTTGAAASTYTTATSTSGLAETTTTAGTGTSFQLRMITTDALGNADTTTVGNFGVDTTAPSTFASTLTAGPPDRSLYQTVGASDAGGQQFTTSGITDNLSGPSINPSNGQVRVLVAQVRNYPALSAAAFDPTVPEGRTYSNTVGVGALNPANATADLSPCMIGRFNAAAANAGPSALPAFNNAGTAIGFCTPVFFDIGGGNVPPNADFAAGVASTGGYYQTEIITVDQAGNRSAPFIRTILEDGASPVVTGVDLPGSITGNTTVSFPATETDNIDLVSSYASVTYAAAGMTLRYPNVAGPGTAFDNVLTRTGTATATVTNFIRNLQVSTGGAAASTITANASTLNVVAVDGVNRTGTLGATLGAVAFNTETASSFAANFTNGFAVTANNNPVYNCPAPITGQTTGCGAAGTVTPTFTATTLTATASGTTAVFNNPFSVVNFFYQNGAGEWVLFASTSAFSVSDNGTIRTYNYPFAFDPPATGPDGMNFTPAPGGTINLPIRAVGVNASGDAVSTTTFNLTITNT